MLSGKQGYISHGKYCALDTHRCGVLYAVRQVAYPCDAECPDMQGAAIAVREGQET